MADSITPTRVFTEEEILTGNRNTRYYLEILDQSESFVARLDGVQSGYLDWIANAVVKGGGQLVVTDVSQPINWLTSRLRPVMVIEGLPEQPLGIFIAAEAPSSWDRGRTWSIKLLDKTALLDRDIITATYSVAAGTVVTTEIATIIAATGITNYSITASTATLTGALIWKPGTSKLRIINDLLAAINYFSLYANFNGQLIGEPYVLPASRPVVYEFLDGPSSIYSPLFDQDADFAKIPNRVVVTGVGDGTTEALTSVAENNDSDSPYSIPNRGVVGYAEEGVEADSQATLDAYARRRLVELTTPGTSTDISHSPLPGLAVNSVVRFRRVPAGIDAKQTVSKTRINLDGKALAQTTIREVVDL